MHDDRTVRDTLAPGTEKSRARLDISVLRNHMRTLAARGPAHVENGRWVLLRRLRPAMGPIQWEHVTEHCSRVSTTARQLACELRLSPHQTEGVRVAGLLHDIGKCIIPERVLAQPEPLSKAQWRLMARHEVCSAWIARRLGLARSASNVVRDHHRPFDASIKLEKGDGTDRQQRGRRSAADSDLPAAIVSVADAMDAMISERPYSPARPATSALEELRSQRGRQFHPAVVDAAHRVGLNPWLAAA
jgi:putative nucleotidyltransferase with HDIG domain